MTKTTTMSREEVECGYCKRVQTNRGGNLGYNCKKHRKSGMSITKITLYTEEQLKEKLTSRDNEWRERVVGLKKTDRYIEVFDNDSHRYQIPFSKVDEWKQFIEIPEDDERSWDVPVWAERIDGQPVTDHQSYNKALDDLLEQMEDK